MSAGLQPAAVGEAEPRRRLNPLSPVLSSIKTTGALIAVLSIQGFVRLGWPAGLGVVLVVMCLAAGVSAISWAVTGYHVVGRELRISDGILVRRHRAIPLERLQAVELVRPLLARLVGLAELRLEVVGGGKTEAPLAFLTVAEAAALRERLLGLAARVGAPVAADTPTGTGGPADPEVAVATGTPPGGEPGRPVSAPPPERHLHRVVNREVVISQLLTPQAMFLPFGVAIVVVQSTVGTGWSLVVLLSSIVAVVGVVLQPVRRMLSDWDFRLALQEPQPGRAEDGPRFRPGLRIRHGLTETRSQTVPLHRVQAIGLTWPLLWRRRRWLRARLDVAGFTAVPDQNAASANQLLPVGDLATARRLVEVALPGVDLATLHPVPAPRRARWLAPVRARVLGAALTERIFATRDGRITRRLVIVPFERIQSVRLVQGPRQRPLGLATLHVDTAGSLTATAYHRELTEARRLAAELIERARRAREAGGAPAAGANATS